MLYRPSRLPFATGCDVCFKPRLAYLLRHGPRRDASRPPRKPEQNVESFLRHLLTPYERKFLWKKWHSAPACLEQERWDGFVSTVAGRWAAKEAVIKACQFRKLSLQDILILKHSSGAPFGVIIDELAATDSTQTSTSISTTGATQDDELEDVSLMDAGPEDEPAASSDESLYTAPASDSQQVLRKASVQSSPKPLSGFKVSVSISHDGDYAMATCLVPWEPQ